MPRRAAALSTSAQRPRYLEPFAPVIFPEAAELPETQLHLDLRTLPYTSLVRLPRSRSDGRLGTGAPLALRIADEQEELVATRAVARRTEVEARQVAEARILELEAEMRRLKNG